MKKAIAVTELTIIILAVAAGIGLILFATKGAQKAGCMTDVTVCKQSLVFFKKISDAIKSKSYGIIDISSAPSVDCVAVSPPNCEEKELKPENVPMTMFIIAENLRYCWDKTNGRKNTIGTDFSNVNNYWIKKVPGASLHWMWWVVKDNVDFCLVCSEFIPKVDIPDADWTNYLENQQMPNSDQTYAQFVNPLKPVSPWGQKYKEFGTPVAFEKGKKYYVVSVSAAETDPDKAAFIYIAPDVNCGDKDPIIHYQLK